MSEVLIAIVIFYAGLILLKPKYIFLAAGKLIACVLLLSGSFKVELNMFMITLISSVLILDIFEIFFIFDKNYEETLKEMHPINLDKRFDNFLLPILTLLGFSVFLLIFGGIDFSDPREYYRTLISFNTTNSSFLKSISFPLLAIFASYMSSFAYSLRNLIFVISFTFLLGSKGLVAVPF